MIPNINANPRGRKTFKRGRKPLFNSAIFKERFHTIERVFGWKISSAACCFVSIASASCTTHSNVGLYDDQPAAFLPGLICQPMPFRDGRTAPGFGTPIRRQNRSSLRNLFQNRHRNTAFPRVYFSDQLFQAAETKNPQPVEWMYQGAFLTKGLEKSSRRVQPDGACL